MFRVSNILVALILGGVSFLTFGSIEAGRSSSYTCILCRLSKFKTSLYGFSHSTYDENECSLWYARNVEPAHAHIWDQGTCERLLNGFGLPIGWACSSSRYAIHALAPSTQMNVYQHFQDRAAARALFSGLTDAKSQNDRLDQEDETKGRLIVRSIQDWEIAGFPGTWDDWWCQWWEKHVAERNEWIAWTHAESNLNFQEWRKLQGGASASAK